MNVNLTASDNLRGYPLPEAHIRVVGLSFDPASISPAPRFRLGAYVNELERLGLSLALSSVVDEGGYRSLISVEKGVKSIPDLLRGAMACAAFRCKLPADVVILQRLLSPMGPAWAETRLFATGTPVIYDFDDSIWLDPSAGMYRADPEPFWKGLLRNRGKIPKLISRSAHVFAGNEFLADYARRHNANVSVIPTVVDTDARYNRVHGHDHGRTPIIGWTGSRSTRVYLDLLKGVMAELGRQEQFELQIICDRPPTDDLGAPYNFRPWRPESEIEDLCAFDIGIMPLLDRDWERGKCGFKIIQYMACGIPAVASDVGVNSEIIRHGVDGFICRTDAEWVEALRTLLNDPVLRAQMGKAARGRIIDAYSVRSQAPRMVEVFRRLTGIHPQA